jgi:hypothetical protein
LNNYFHPHPHSGSCALSNPFRRHSHSSVCALCNLFHSHPHSDPWALVNPFYLVSHLLVAIAYPMERQWQFPHFIIKLLSSNFQVLKTSIERTVYIVTSIDRGFLEGIRVPPPWPPI